MAKNKNYQYWADARTSSHGRMQCSVCGKKIAEGQYRHHTKSEAFVTTHRACCPDDQAWKKRDAERAEHARYNATLLEEATAFRSKWNVDCLDELISELQ